MDNLPGERVYKNGDSCDVVVIVGFAEELGHVDWIPIWMVV